MSYTKLVYWDCSSWFMISIFVYGTWFLTFCSPFWLFSITNMLDSQKGTSFFSSINRFERTPIYASLNTDLGCKLDNFLWQDLNSCYKSEIASGNMMLSIFYCVRLFYSFIWSSEEIGIDTIYGTLIDLRRSLLTNIFI